MRRIALTLCLAVLMAGCGQEEPTKPTGAKVAFNAAASAPTVTLTWDPSLNASGYKVYSGPTSQSYGTPIDVGTVTTVSIPNPTGGRAFFAVTAYDATGAESGFSNEAVFSPASPTPGPATPTPVAVQTATPRPATPSPTRAPTATPGPTPTPVQGPTVTSLKLVRNSPGGQVVMNLVNGLVIDLSVMPTTNLNVQGFSSLGNSGVIRFVLDSSIDHTEATSPFAMCGDWDPCPANTLLKVGNHLLTVQAGQSTTNLGQASTIQFSVVQGGSPTVSPSPRPTASPSPVPLPSASPSCTPCNCR